MLDWCPKLIKTYNFGQIAVNKRQSKNKNEHYRLFIFKVAETFCQFLVRDCQYFLLWCFLIPGDFFHFNLLPNLFSFSWQIYDCKMNSCFILLQMFKKWEGKVLTTNININSEDGFSWACRLTLLLKMVKWCAMQKRQRGTEKE